MGLGSMMFRRFRIVNLGPYVGPFINSNGEGFVRLNAGQIERSLNPPDIDFVLLSPNVLEAYITSNKDLYAKYASSYEMLQLGIYVVSNPTEAQYIGAQANILSFL